MIDSFPLFMLRCFDVSEVRETLWKDNNCIKPSMVRMFEYLWRVSPNAKLEAMHKVDTLYTLFFDHQLHATN